MTAEWWTLSSKRATSRSFARSGCTLLLLLLLLAGSSSCGSPARSRAQDPGRDAGADPGDLSPGDLSPGDDLALTDASPGDLVPADDIQPADSSPEDLGHPEDAADAGEAPGSFSLATYNVHNLFDTVDDPEEDDVLTPEELEDKLTRLAGVIRSLDADVVALQEVEHEALLDQLLAQPQLADAGYVRRELIESTHPRGIDVAVLSRLPLDQVISHRNDRWVDGDRSFYFNPDCLELRFRVGERPVLVFVNHLPSMLGGEEAAVIRQAIGRRLRFLVDSSLSFFPAAHVAVVGDFNDLPDSATLLGARGTGPEALVNLGELVPSSYRYTYVYRGTRQMLDYLLATPGLARAVVPGSTRILHTAASEQASDHSPVVTRFSWGD